MPGVLLEYKMGIRDMVGGVTDIIPVENVLISVYQKEGLEDFVFDMIDINPNIRFISTGGTYRTIKEAFGDKYGDVHCFTMSYFYFYGEK